MFFFKKKATLEQLIPSNYIDIHSHILPEIDDGAATHDACVDLLTQIKSKGFYRCILTPHTLPEIWDNTSEGIKLQFQKTKEKLSSEQRSMLQGVASEYMINEAFLERLAKEPLLTLKDNYILIEMSYLNPPYGLEDIIYEIRHRGYEPILAHPERYMFYHRDLKIYEKLKKLDLKFQLNLLSTVGYYGKHVAKVADYLLKADLIDFVGSDIHHQRHIKFFEHKIVIKSTKNLQKALEANSFFND
jgi:protein-tyrosine phosphatase